MKKLNILKSLALFFLIITSSACEKVDITHWSITHVNSIPPFVNEEIKLLASVRALRDDARVYPKEYRWSLMDSIGNIIKDDFPDEREVIWVANEVGRFKVNLKLKFGIGNVKIISKDIFVEIDPRQAYTGEYHFTKISRFWAESNPFGTLDTTYTDGFIHTHPDKKGWINIRCGEDDGEYFSAEIEYLEGATHPSYVISRNVHVYNYGNFFDFDSINIIKGGGGLGGGVDYKYHGKKIKN